MDYTAPTITELGSLRDLTLAPTINKSGPGVDAFSNQLGPGRSITFGR